MRKISFLIIPLFLFVMYSHSQLPGKDSLFLNRQTSFYSSMNMSTGQTRGSTNISYFYKLGKNSEFVKVKGRNYKKIVDIFPASSRKYHQCISQSKQATALGATAIVLAGTFIAGVIVGGKNIGNYPAIGFTGIGVAGLSMAGVFILPRIANKKANKALQYFEESADAYNASLQK